MLGFTSSHTSDMQGDHSLCSLKPTPVSDDDTTICPAASPEEPLPDPLSEEPGTPGDSPYGQGNWKTMASPSATHTSICGHLSTLAAADHQPAPSPVALPVAGTSTPTDLATGYMGHFTDGTRYPVGLDSFCEPSIMPPHIADALPD